MRFRELHHPNILRCGCGGRSGLLKVHHILALRRLMDPYAVCYPLRCSDPGSIRNAGCCGSDAMRSCCGGDCPIPKAARFTDSSSRRPGPWDSAGHNMRGHRIEGRVRPVGAPDAWLHRWWPVGCSPASRTAGWWSAVHGGGHWDWGKSGPEHGWHCPGCSGRSSG